MTLKLHLVKHFAFQVCVCLKWLLSQLLGGVTSSDPLSACVDSIAFFITTHDLVVLAISPQLLALGIAMGFVAVRALCFFRESWRTMLCGYYREDWTGSGSLFGIILCCCFTKCNCLLLAGNDGIQRTCKWDQWWFWLPVFKIWQYICFLKWGVTFLSCYLLKGKLWKGKMPVV